MWWHDASQQDGYLDARYKRRGITYRNRNDGNRPNFNPLIRLVWNFHNLGPTERVLISQCNKALQALHEQYSANPEDFNHNPEGKLTALIQSKGGVSGLAETVTLAGADDDDHEGEPSEKQNRANQNSAETLTAEIARQALQEIKASKGIGEVTPKEPVRVGNDSLLVLLARQEKDGRVTILGSSNDPGQIEAVAAAVARGGLTNVPRSLRALVEILATQAFPSHALPSSHEQRAKWYRTKYADKGDLYESDLEGWELEERGRRLTSSKRLLLRGKTREAIFSGSLMTVSPVTRCILNEPLIEEGDAVFLRTTERVQIEGWYETGELALLQAEPEFRLERATKLEAAAYKLTVKNAITGSTKHLHFYLHSPDNVTHHQAEFRREAFEPTWRAEVSGEWFGNVRQEWGDKWFAELGRYNQITRKNNAVLQLKVTDNEFHVIFNRHPDASASEVFEFPKQIRIFAQPQTTTYLSKDLAPILFNLADAPASGPVTVAGNNHAIVFTYNTSVGQFEIAVPTLDGTGKHRDSTLFYAADRKQ